MNAALRRRAARRLEHGAKIAVAIFSVLLTAGPAAAFECHAALVLALDASDSVDREEAALQRRGVALALLDPEVRAAITPAPGMGVMIRIFEWSDPGRRLDLAPWTRLDGPAAADLLADRILGAPDIFLDGQTGLGAAMRDAARAFDEIGGDCRRRIIDVSGDGPGNSGPPPGRFSMGGVFRGMTVNGLVIRNPALDSAQPPGRDPLPYYQRHVRQGPGAFLKVIRGYEDYADAIREKLLRELSPSVAALP